MANKRQKKRPSLLLDAVIIVVLVSITAIFLFPTQQTGFSSSEDINLVTDITSTSLTKVSDTGESLTLEYNWKTGSSSSASDNFRKELTVKFNVPDFEDIQDKITLENIPNQFDVQVEKVSFTGIKALTESQNVLEGDDIKIKNQDITCDMIIQASKPIVTCEGEVTFYVEENDKVVPANFYGNIDGYTEVTFIKEAT